MGRPRFVDRHQRWTLSLDAWPDPAEDNGARVVSLVHERFGRATDSVPIAADVWPALRAAIDALFAEREGKR